jgi:hypothetical protein
MKTIFLWSKKWLLIYNKWIKYLALAALIVIFILNFHLYMSIGASSSLNERAFLFSNVNLELTHLTLEEIHELRDVLTRHNLLPIIRNRHYLKNSNLKNSVATTRKTPQQLSVKKVPEFMVLLVQVHSRNEYLKELIESLKETRFINQTLLIFSHDIFNHETNRLIDSIEFCATMQIFYPYSLQLYPLEFPGHSPNDCPKKAKKAK